MDNKLFSMGETFKNGAKVAEAGTTPATPAPAPEQKQGAAVVVPHQTARDRWNEYAERFAMLPQTTRTGFPIVDTALKITGLATLGAGSGAGKTTFALNVLANRIAEKLPTIFITLEMSAPEILQRLASIIYTKYNPQGTRIMCNGIEPQHIRQLNDPKIIPLDMDYLTFIEYGDTNDGDFDPDRVALDVAKYRQKYNNVADVLVIIDSLNLLNAEGNDERRAVNQTIRKLSRFTKTYGVSILLIAQLTKQALTTGEITEIDPANPSADFSKLLYDFRESALIPYLSDSCFFLIGDRMTDTTSTRPDVWICSAKNRRAAINSKVCFTFDKETFLFTEK